MRWLLRWCCTVLVLLLPIANADPLQGQVNQSEYLPFHGPQRGIVSKSAALIPGTALRDTTLPFSGPGRPVPNVSNVPSQWMLRITPNTVVIAPVNSIVHFRRFDFTNKLETMNAWNDWARRLLHMAYANLQTFDGRVGRVEYTAYVRADGAIHVTVHSNSSPEIEEATTKSFESLAGMNELSFPATAGGDDTVFITGSVSYGPDQTIQRDVWGRDITHRDSRKFDQSSW